MPNPVLKSALLRVLDDQPTRRINFVIGGFPIRPALYTAVRREVAADRIDVNADPRRTSTALYDSGADAFLFGWSAVNTDTRRAHIIHEATHAGSDVAGYNGMGIDVSEAAAYIAQCWYMRLKVGAARAGRDRLRGNYPGTDKIFEKAWDIAGQLITNRFFHRTDGEELRRRIMSFGGYNPTGSDTPTPCHYDGVGG